MSGLHNSGETRRHGPHRVLANRVEVSCMEFFLENTQKHGIRDIHIDVFQSVRSSELSFVNYVDLILFVTAVDVWHHNLYEYAQLLGTSAVSTDETTVEDELLRLGRDKLSEVEHTLTGLGYHVEHGRLVDQAVISP